MNQNMACAHSISEYMVQNRFLPPTVPFKEKYRGVRDKEEGPSLPSGAHSVAHIYGTKLTFVFCSLLTAFVFILPVSSHKSPVKRCDLILQR